MSSWRGRTFTASSTTAAGLFPFVAGAGAPASGVLMGRHLLWREPVRLDPFDWLAAGLTTNTGMFQLGQPGTGKSAFAKRQILGMVSRAVTPVVLGDPKGEYSELVERLGGQVIRIGPGLDRINPLDAASSDSGDAEVRSRRLSVLLGLCALVRADRPMGNAEHVLLAAAVDAVAAGCAEPTLLDVVRVLRNPSASMLSAVEVSSAGRFEELTRELRWTLRLLTEGALAGMFDGRSTKSFDPGAPAVAVDLSAVADDAVLSAAMLSCWAWGQAAVREAGRRRTGARWLIVMDELWRALRGGPGLVEHMDALTRLGRSQGVASLMITHSLADLETMSRHSDIAKAQGFVDRSAIVVLSGLPRRELDQVRQIVAMSDAEVAMVAGWSSAHRWRSQSVHPGRGKYLIKTGNRPGIPLDMELTATERALYATDPQERMARLAFGEYR